MSTPHPPPAPSGEWIRTLAMGLAIAGVFLALNYRAWDGFFQDDELDTISWAPSMTMRDYAIAIVKPTFDSSNFRPPGHLYFTLMGRAAQMDFPPYITPVFIIHLANALLLFALLRRLTIGRRQALAGAAFFALSATAMDAYWKPMYVYDLLCTTFCLLSILFWARGRPVLSFLAFWCAYKSKELAVMLPIVLLLYEYWFGRCRFLLLIPFFATSLSFGLQGILLNPNKDNAYTFRFNSDALRRTIPFYAHRFLFFRASGLAILALAFIRDRRVWFGLAGMVCFLFPLLFLPGRLFEAYAYLPLAMAAVAMAGGASHMKPVFVWAALALWMPFNARELRLEQRAKLADDDQAAAFVDKLQAWAVKHPEVRTLVYDGASRGYHNWGVTAAWNIAHRSIGLPALYVDSRDAAKALESDLVADAHWDSNKNTLTVQIHSPSR